MIVRSPFTVIPWGNDFLPALLDFALQNCPGGLGGATFIFPHNRPARYLTLLVRRREDIAKPVLLPRMHAISGMFAMCRERMQARPAFDAGLLDRVGLLMRCAREEVGENADSDKKGLDSLAFFEPQRFFPWGVRLAALFEECFNQRRRPRDFSHLEGQVSPCARALLERLGGIFARYESGLAERDWTTPGHAAFVVAAHIEANGELPPGLLPCDGPIFIAGFHALTRVENTLFRHLWERGAHIVLHADPDVTLGPGQGHWSCRALEDWIKDWGAGARLFSDGQAKNRKDPVYRFVAGYDLHSQLAQLGNCFAPAAGADQNSSGAFERASAPAPDSADAADMADAADTCGTAGDRPADTAVILPDSGLLLPVLHHLPRTDINISMGYPLARSPLFRLVDTLLRLQERRRGQGYYWRELVDLLRHPYIKSLRDAPEPADAENSGAEPGAGPETSLADGKPAPQAAPAQTPLQMDETGEAQDARTREALRRELHLLERALRQRGDKYIEPRAFLLDEYQQREPEAMPPPVVLVFLEKLLSVTLDAFADPDTPSDLAAGLQGLCDMLLAHGAHLWPHFPIDAECLYRLRQSIIPELARSALADENLEPKILFALLRSLMQGERVPFEAAPLVGTQVMGMLESRLLTFRRVIVVDAVEKSLPGSPQSDPLLPEPLRPELGLPPLHSREQVAAYHFFRLIQSADEITLIWREGEAAPDEGGKSRFIEELLWEKEKQRGRLFAAGRDDPPLYGIPAMVSPIVKSKRALAVTPAIRDLMLSTLARPVSASLLDAYLFCPLRFFYERAARLNPADEVSEGDDPLAVGEMLHLVLHDVYQNLIGRPLPGGEALAAMLGGELAAAFAASPDLARLGRALPADSFAMLVASGKKRLAEYLAAQPETMPLALEETFTVNFNGLSPGIRLVGKMDRIDLRTLALADEEARPCLTVLDYKTGNIPKVSSDIWENDALWESMENWTPESAPPPNPGEARSDPVLSSLGKSLSSVQLPFYLLLHRLAREQGIGPLRAADDAPGQNGRRELAAVDAGWVALADKGQELPLFSNAISFETRSAIIRDKVPRIVNFLLRHMAETPVLFPRADQHCDWCTSAKLCIVHGASVNFPVKNRL